MNVGIPFTPDFNNGMSTIGVSRVSGVGILVLVKVVAD